LAFATLIVLAASIRFGAIDFSIADITHALASLVPGNPEPTLDQRIFLELRLPRAVLCLFVGASLGVGGTLMQALFRNPIVEPGLVGTSSGAAFGSAFFFVLGGVLHLSASIWTLPLAACFGGVVSTYLVFLLAKSREDGRASIVMLLLTGLAVNALFMSAIGFLSYIARDPQARSITFWSLGTLSGANWKTVVVVSISTGRRDSRRHAVCETAERFNDWRRGGHLPRCKCQSIEVDHSLDQCRHRGGGHGVYRSDQLCRIDRAAHFADVRRR